MHHETNELQHKLHNMLLPSLDKAILSYQDFARHADGAFSTTDSKEFSAYQSACKAALGHIESIIKLSRFVDAPGQTQHGNLPDDEWQDAISELSGG